MWRAGTASDHLRRVHAALCRCSANGAAVKRTEFHGAADTKLYAWTPCDGVCAGCCQLLPSLLDFWPEAFRLPPFGDLIEGAIPLDPVWRLRGAVVRGFGRGSKVPVPEKWNGDDGDNCYSQQRQQRPRRRQR